MASVSPACACRFSASMLSENPAKQDRQSVSAKRNAISLFMGSLLKSVVQKNV